MYLKKTRDMDELIDQSKFKKYILEKRGPYQNSYAICKYIREIIDKNLSKKIGIFEITDGKNVRCEDVRCIDDCIRYLNLKNKDDCIFFMKTVVIFFQH